MSTKAIYWQEPLRRNISAVVVDSHVLDDIVHIALDQTIFYPRGGGQPGDMGTLQVENESAPLIETIKNEDDIIWHRVEQSTTLNKQTITAGISVQLTLDWERRWRLMRTHTAMHLLCAAVDAPVTGGSMDALRGRIDFDCDILDKQQIESQMNAWVEDAIPITTNWADIAQLKANPSWIRTRGVSPPQQGSQVRVVKIGDIDTQTCGGTHVASTNEVGTVQVTKTEKKGRQNRRVIFTLQDEV